MGPGMSQVKASLERKSDLQGLWQRSNLAALRIDVEAQKGRKQPRRVVEGDVLLRRVRAKMGCLRAKTTFKPGTCS